MEQMTFEEACSAVADLFEAIPETWTKYMVARDKNGNSTSALSADATCWCAQGGLCAALYAPSPWMLGDIDKLNVPALALGYTGSADANNRGGRLVAIRILRMASGEIK